MENPQIIALVAIAISLFGLGLSFVAPIGLQSDIRNLNDKLIDQSQTIKFLSYQLNGSTPLINTQDSIINNLKTQQNASLAQINSLQTNVANMTNQINLLENRVALLEQKINQITPNPTPKPSYFPGVVKFYNVVGGGTAVENRIFKQLPSTISEGQWDADFDYKFTASSMPSFLIFVLSATNSDPQSQTHPNLVIINHGGYSGADALDVEGPLGTISTPIPISLNVQYYISLEKTSTQFRLSVFSDPARTIHVSGSPQTLAILPTDYSNNLNYLQHDGCRDCGSGRSITSELDNMKISVIDSLGNKRTFFEDHYSSSAGWTQVGSSVAVNGSFFQEVPPVYRDLPMLQNDSGNLVR